MMTFITTEDFQLGAFIPNRDDAPNSDIIGNEPVLQGFIDEEVKNILVKLLGWELYAELQAQEDATDPILDPGADQKWHDLVDGKDDYRGLKHLLVPYVFCQFLLNDNEDYASAGINQIESDGATRRRPNRKILNQYKKFYESAIGDYGSEPTIVVNNYGVGFIYGYTYGISKSGFKSLFQYLSENIDDFSNWKPAGVPKEMNAYDI